MSHDFKWRLLRKIPLNHRWFLDENSGRVSCCDQSGNTPHMTDDGPLWLNRDRPIILGDQDGRMFIQTPVIQGKNDEPTCVSCTLKEMIYLVREQGMRVEIHAPCGDMVKLFCEMKSIPA